MAHKAVAKHKTIFDAFGVTERSSSGSLNRMDSAYSAGKCCSPTSQSRARPTDIIFADVGLRNIETLIAGNHGKAEHTDDLSSQSTWTAGMTKGLPAKELVAQLKRNRSAPDLEESEESSTPDLQTVSPSEGPPATFRSTTSTQGPPPSGTLTEPTLSGKVRGAGTTLVPWAVSL